MFKKYFLWCLLLLLCFPAFAQKKNEAYQLPIRKTSLPIQVDGVMDEEAWQATAVAKDFFMVLPMDTSFAKSRTEVRMAYDDEYLYLIAHCYHAAPGPYVVESLRRDFEFGKNDNFLLFMDPFDDQTNGFSFGSNAAGAQWDGTMFNGGSVDLNWDNKWVSVVKNDPEKWVLEMAIPFTTIRYKKGISRWGINFSRLDLKTTEKSSWAPVPRQFPTASLAYSGNLVWDQPPPTTGANVSVIPYVLGGVSKNHERGEATTYQKKVGTDVKIGITSALNLDLTINPDFSQVEVDRQVANLDRFELFFPERRQFFLENGDLFGNFGSSTIRPFFSRRIGLGVPIRAGARLSGKLNKDWRIGLMDMQTARVEETGLPAQNFAIATLQRRVFARSSVGLLFVNKESLNYHPEQQDTLYPTYSQYNRNLGVEYNLASANNAWTGKAFVLKSFSPGGAGSGLAQAANLEYRSRHYSFQLQEEYVGNDFTAEVGYVPRRNYFKVSPSVSRLFFPSGGPVLSHGPRLSTTYFFDSNLNRTDNLNLLFYTLNFRSQSQFMVILIDEYVRLLQPFDPTNSGREPLARGTRHHWNAVRTDFSSKPQSVFTYGFSTRFGQYYGDGSWTNLAGEVGYRFQPYVNIQANASYNDIRLPEREDTRFWLVGSRVNVTLTNKLFFSNFLQYNEQANNLNLNTRFQWRYQPASDLFIVYTDNYLPAPFSIRSRALVLKLTYWWNK